MIINLAYCRSLLPSFRDDVVAAQQNSNTEQTCYNRCWSYQSRDIQYLRQQAKSSIKRYIDERLSEEYEKCLVGLTAILREAWTASQDTEDKREKIQALLLAKECFIQ